jgi:hypothetical protein
MVYVKVIEAVRQQMAKQKKGPDPGAPPGKPPSIITP